jgi:hypothetical protein
MQNAYCNILHGEYLKANTYFAVMFLGPFQSEKRALKPGRPEISALEKSLGGWYNAPTRRRRNNDEADCQVWHAGKREG